MDKLILKYLITKMSLGYGYSFDYKELSNLETYLFNRKINFKEEYDNKYVTFDKDKFIANYELTREVLDVFTINYKEFNLIKNFIIKHIQALNINEKNTNIDNLNRSKEICIYLIEILNTLYRKRDVKYLDGLDMKEFDSSLIEPFDKISNCISNLLNIDNSLIISNLDIRKSKLLSYRTFCNYALIDRNLDKILSKYTKNGKYSFYLDFTNNKYYGMPSYKQDMLVIARNDSIYTPIYIPRVKSADEEILKHKDKVIDEARDKIKILYKTKELH